MKIYNMESEAVNASGNVQFVNKICPFHIRMSSRTMCGSWCPHFHMDKKEIFITCSGAEVCIGVKE